MALELSDYVIRDQEMTGLQEPELGMKKYLQHQVASNQNLSPVKLTQIEMKAFNGDPKEYVQCWDFFERNIDKNLPSTMLMLCSI